MSTKIRLKRIGRRNKPFYRVVVMDSRKKRDGAFIEELGWYNPVAGKSEQDYSLKGDRVLYWLNEGAQITDIVHHLFKREGIAHKWHLMKQGLDEASIEKEMQKWALDRTEVEKRRKVKIKLGKKEKAKQKKLTEEPAEETIEAVAGAKEEETLEEVPTEKSEKEESAETTDVEEKAEEPAEGGDDGKTEEEEPETEELAEEGSDSKSDEKDKDVAEEEASPESGVDEPTEETIEAVAGAKEEETLEEVPTEKSEKEESAETTDVEEKAEEPAEGGDDGKTEEEEPESGEPIEKTIVEKKSDKKELKKADDVSSENGDQEKDTGEEALSDSEKKNDSNN